MLRKHWSVVLCWGCWWLGYPAAAQPSVLADVEQAFSRLSKHPQVGYFSVNPATIPPGGHLQGIQGWIKAGKTDVVLTGSSARYAYLLKTGLWPQPQQVQISRLLTKPYRHAGGNQLNGRTLAVGIEDNAAKDKSVVMLVPLDDSLHPLQPRQVAARAGQYKRSTAGATGFTGYRNGHLIAVADWDARNIDFYFSSDAAVAHFDSITTFHAPNNDPWCAYQNINLLTDSAGRLYLLGLGRDAKGNRADLFQITGLDDEVRCSLKNTRYFRCKARASFRYGAGVVVQGGQLVLYTCQRNLHRKNAINVFREE